MFWGAWAVLFPSAIFSWLDMPQPNYPQFWQCIGMIVGVYGVGCGKCLSLTVPRSQTLPAECG